RGMVQPNSPLFELLTRYGLSHDILDRFLDRPVQPDVIGINMYPMFSKKHLSRTSSGRLLVRIKRCGAETFAEIARMYAQRYRLPLMCAETAAIGRARVPWIGESVKKVRELRGQGTPIIGYTYWPLFSLVAWAYQRGHAPLEDYLLHMGLWNLVPGRSGTLQRQATPAVQAYQSQILAPMNLIAAPE
ncbi:MAG TPA: hypothetical protein VGS41_12915, partial [Chthonomonadales bacterium]|nr:hypothetical protein [Chthonomonadales bacterium]